MKRLSPPPSESPAAHHLCGWGAVHVRGSGTLSIGLRGTGRLEVSHLRETAFAFEGHGARRFPDGDHLIVAAARGRLHLHGRRLDVVLHRGDVDLETRGVFKVVLDGRGTWRTITGEVRRWGDGPRCVDLTSPPSPRAPIRQGEV